VKFGSVWKGLEALETPLARLQSQHQNEGTMKKIMEITREMDEMIYREEMLWL